MKQAKVSRAVWDPEYRRIDEDAPKYLYGDTKSGLRTNSTDSKISDCSPFCDEPSFCVNLKHESVFFALRIEPTEPLVFSALTYKAGDGSVLAKDATHFFIEKGKRRRMNEFNCMPMVLVRGAWEERPELIGLEIKEWNSVLEKQGLFPYPCHGYGNDNDMDEWFEEECKMKGR